MMGLGLLHFWDRESQPKPSFVSDCYWLGGRTNRREVSVIYPP